MIRLNVFVQTEPAKVAEAVAIARLLTEASQQEKGCIAYDVFTSATRLDVFMFCETWENEEALLAHQASTHYQELGAKLQELAQLKIERFEF